jgi:DUF1009 family protein
MSPEPPLAVIAGAGRFPFHVAREARRQGRRVVAVGIQGWADPSLASQVDAAEEIPLGQLGRLIRYLASQGVREAVMAGKVTKEALLQQPGAMDEELRSILQRARHASAASLLGAIGQRLAREGIALLDSSTFLRDDLCPLGVQTARPPTAAEEADIAVGREAARAIAALDIGQTVVVKERVVVAVEALEGTDAAVRRARALAGAGLVVVKMGSPQQDRRFDLPVIGIETIATLREAGASCLAVEAGTALLLDRRAVCDAADAAALCLIGVAAS